MACLDNRSYDQVSQNNSGGDDEQQVSKQSEQCAIEFIVAPMPETK